VERALAALLPGPEDWRAGVAARYAR
jgi:hypothetical protein